MSTLDARSHLRMLLRERAVLRGDFVLSSGARSNYYLDARLVTLSAEGSKYVGQVMLDELLPDLPDAIAGPTVGADPIVSATIVTAALAGQRLDGLLVRKGRKEHGAGRQIEGPWREGLRVAVVDDTLTTGNSLLEAAAALREAGGIVTGLYALIDREQGAREAIEGAGYRFTALFTAKELLG